MADQTRPEHFEKRASFTASAFPRRRRWANDDPAEHAVNAAAAAGGDVLLRGPQVCAIIGVSLATLYRMLKASEFPEPISPTRGTRAWPMSVVQAWIKERAADGAGNAR